ncbi:hypothetical protein GGS26DRAFT_582327 [Hypomontagnella submonticulosa]|nr:hypothetical protein GGS26DRAFT_582327 [Hypomontagnella submonticulosa]
MHSLWSRAAQAQSSCRCRICLHSGRTIIRRSTNAAPKRKITAGDIFTACYTTILGTATVLDAARKDARKKELDEKLEKARAALSTLSTQDSPGQQGRADYHADSGVTTTSQSRSRGSSGNEPNAASVTKALFQELGPIYGITPRPLPRPLWIQTQLDWAEVESAIVAEERDPGYTLREPVSARKLERTTTTVIDLVNQLKWRVQTSESTRSQDALTMKGERSRSKELAWKELEDALCSPHYPCYYHPSEDVEDAVKARSLLGESIRRIFNQAASSTEMVAKICYNILACRVPPSIHTYNVLIAGFNRIQRPDLAQTVIDSYIHKTTWPATQQTIVCLLNHYRGTNQVEGLRDIIQRMRGVKDDGLHFRIIDKAAIRSKHWLDWATENCASRKHAFVQKAHRNDDVFNSIIKGWLYCGELGNACMAFVACLRNGGSVTIQTLQELFTACITTVDYQAARRLVRGFAKNVREFVTLLNRIIHQESIATSRQVILSISQLLDVCWLPPDKMFASDLKAHDKTLQRLRSFVDTTRFKLEIQETAQLCKATFKEIHSFGPLVDRLDRAIATIDSAQRSREKVTEAHLKFSRLAGFASMERSYHRLEARIKTTTALVTAAIIKIKTGYDFDPSGLLASKQPTDYHQKIRHESLVNALQSIQIRRGPMTQDGIRSQLLQRLPDPILAERLKNSGNPENLAIRTLTSFYASNPNTPRSENSGHNGSISKLERELTGIEDTTKAILFSHLNCDRQRYLRHRYPDWYQMPLEPLVKYHMRRQRKSVREVSPSIHVDIKQTDVVESRDHENPARRATEEPWIALEDPRESDDMATSKRRAANLADIEGVLRLGRPIPNFRSANPSVLRDEDVHLPLVALG